MHTELGRCISHFIGESYGWHDIRVASYDSRVWVHVQVLTSVRVTVAPKHFPGHSLRHSSPPSSRTKTISQRAFALIACPDYS
jgi:hypothetical protein